MQRSRDIAGLLAIMKALRDPVSGCPWDLKQTFRSIAPYTLEEAYEVADAIEREDQDDLRDELGDLLLQVVFHAQIAEEADAFDFGDVVDAITGKLIRRHPHVFGPADRLTPDQVKLLWGEIKSAERAERARERGVARSGLLDDIPSNHPALTRAVKLQGKASTVGFDWHDTKLVLDKIREETAEVAEAVEGGDTAAIQDELGDLLFAVVNLARHAGIDPEAALRGGNAKFERRFRHVEDRIVAAGRTLSQSSLAEMEALWGEAKRTERG